MIRSSILLIDAIDTSQFSTYVTNFYVPYEVENKLYSNMN